MNPRYDADCDREKLAGKTIAIVGYGSQGRAHARNLRDGGYDVIAALRRIGPVAVSVLPGREENIEFRLPAELMAG